MADKTGYDKQFQFSQLTVTHLDHAQYLQAFVQSRNGDYIHAMSLPAGHEPHNAELNIVK